MVRVLNGNVWIDGRFYARGTAPTGEIAARIGDHLWTELSSAPAPLPVNTVMAENQPRVTVERPSQFMSVPVAQYATELVVPPVTDGPARTVDGPDIPESDDPEGDPAPPPRSGKGGAESAWQGYATAMGLDISQANGRNEIIALVRDAGFPV